MAAMVSPLAVSEQVVQAGQHAAEAVAAAADLAPMYLVVVRVVVRVDRACFDGVVPFSS